MSPDKNDETEMIKNLELLMNMDVLEEKSEWESLEDLETAEAETNSDSEEEERKSK